jgi:hypothetical protein
VNGTVEVQDLVGEYPALDGPRRDANRQASPEELRNTLLVDSVTARDRAPRDHREDSLGRRLRFGQECLVDRIEVIGCVARIERKDRDRNEARFQYGL